MVSRDTVDTGTHQQTNTIIIFLRLVWRVTRGKIKKSDIIISPHDLYTLHISLSNTLAPDRGPRLPGKWLDGKLILKYLHNFCTIIIMNLSDFSIKKIKLITSPKLTSIIWNDPLQCTAAWLWSFFTLLFCPITLAVYFHSWSVICGAPSCITIVHFKTIMSRVRIDTGHTLTHLQGIKSAPRLLSAQ